MIHVNFMAVASRDNTGGNALGAFGGHTQSNSFRRSTTVHVEGARASGVSLFLVEGKELSAATSDRREHHHPRGAPLR
jgi:hypothetical protein